MSTAMTGRAALPHPKPVRDLLEDLLGRGVAIAPRDPWKPEPAEMATVAEMVGDDGALHALVALDLPLAVYAGAAIGLTPAPGARDMVAEKDPTPMVVANTCEVLNVLSAVWNHPGNPHTRLGTVHGPGELLPQHVNLWLATLGNREDLTVEIAGYGSGVLTIIGT